MVPAIDKIRFALFHTTLDYRIHAARIRKGQKIAKPPLTLQVTTLWEYPSQHYGAGLQGNPNYRGATPSYIIWNLLQRYTREKWLVVDPMCGSGTTLDVARDTGRRALGYDLNPQRPDIFHHDARNIPLEDEKADFVFIDPPYSTHLEYSDDPRCVGKASAADGSYYQAMREVITEINRILRPDRYMGLYVSDSYVHGKQFHPIGFELFNLLQEYFEPVDIISVVRHNKTLEMGNYRKAAEEENFFLRGFNYLFIMHKPKEPKIPAPKPESARTAANPTKPTAGHGKASQSKAGGTVQPNANAPRSSAPKKSYKPGKAGEGRKPGKYSQKPAAPVGPRIVLTADGKPGKPDWRGMKKRKTPPK